MRGVSRSPSILAVVLHLLAVLALAGAVSAKPANVGATAAEKLSALVARSDEAGLRLVPQNALWRGDGRYADQFGDLISDDWIRALRESAESDEQDLLAIDRAALSAMDQLVYDTFRFTIELSLRSYRSGLAELAARMPLDHLAGQHLTFPQLASGESVAPFKTVKDYEDGRKRMEGFATFLDGTIPRMREGIARGQVQIRVVTEKVIGQIDLVLARGLEGSDFLKPTRNWPADIGKADQARLGSDYRRTVQGRVFPAYRRLRAFMAEEYLPASRTSAPGLCSLPGGDALYQWNLESFTTTRMTAQEIHEHGLQEVARITREMEEVKEELGLSGSLRDFFRTLDGDPRFRYADGAAVLARMDALRARVEPMLPRFFGLLPRAGVEVRPIPAAQESSAGGAYYQVGTPDGSRKGVIFLNTSAEYLRTLPRATALFLHEGVPGHHVQGSLAQEDESLPAFLRFGYFLGFGEGWGLYCEWLGHEMGLYTDPVQRFGALDMDMIRAQRMVIDTGLHAKGWSRDQAIQYALDYSTMSRKEAEDAVDRYIVWPGQATAYSVGKIFMMRLRARAQEELGSRFDLRRFHDQVLGTGALPLLVLEAKIQGWIAAERAAPSPSDQPAKPRAN